ncbi:MAG: hypothetical protein RLZZ361_889, partial [Cyanobacteriota bacterium]
MKKIIFLFIIFSVSSLQVFASTDKIYEVEFEDGKTIYMYSGTKTTLRINQIPPDLNSVQLSVVEKPSSPKASIIGKRLKAVNTGNSSSYADFIIDIPEIPHGTNIKELIQLDLKTFKKTSERAYEVVDRHTYYIRPTTCPPAGDNVCGSYKSKCRKGSTNCNEDTTFLKTY